MNQYSVLIYDIKNLEKPILLQEVVIDNVRDKQECMDKAHDEAYRLFPDKKRMVSIRKL